MAILSLGLLIQEYLPHPVRFILRKRGAQLFAAHRPLLRGEEKIEIYLGCFAAPQARWIRNLPNPVRPKARLTDLS